METVSIPHPRPSSTFQPRCLWNGARMGWKADSISFGRRLQWHLVSLALRFSACRVIGLTPFIRRQDLERLLSLQENDGRFPAGHFYCMGRTGVRIGNRALTTALVAKILSQGRNPWTILPKLKSWTHTSNCGRSWLVLFVLCAFLANNKESHNQIMLIHWATWRVKNTRALCTESFVSRWSVNARVTTRTMREILNVCLAEDTYFPWVTAPL